MGDAPANIAAELPADLDLDQLDRIEAKVDRLLAVLDEFAPALAMVKARVERKAGPSRWRTG